MVHPIQILIPEFDLDANLRLKQILFPILNDLITSAMNECDHCNHIY